MNTELLFDCIFDCNQLGKELGKGISSMFDNPKLPIIIADKKGFVLLNTLPHKVRRRNLFKAKKLMKNY